MRTLLVLILLIGNFFTLVHQTQSDMDSNLPVLEIDSKINDESDSYDTFDIHPANRWSSSDFSSTFDSSINNSELVTKKYSNATENMLYTRKLQSTDDKIEMRWRMNNTDECEYFQNALFDALDFEEGDTEKIDCVATTSTLTVANGLFIAELYRSGGSVPYLYYNDVSLDYETPLSFVEIKFRSNVTFSSGMTWRNSAGAAIWASENAVYENNTWYTVNLIPNGNENGKQFWFYLGGSHNIHFKWEIEYIKFGYDSLDTDNDLFDFGIYDLENSDKLLQVKCDYSTNTSLVMTINCLDSDGNTQASYTSGSLTLNAEDYYIAKLEFNLYESDFGFKLYNENNSRLLNVDYPDDFTETERPSVFNLKYPSVYFASETENSEVSYREIYLDYILAKFEIQAWTQVDTPTHADYTTDRWDAAYLEDDCADTSQYRLVVDDLDTVNWDVIMKVYGDFSTNDLSTMQLEIAIYNTCANNGTLAELIHFYGGMAHAHGVADLRGLGLVVESDIVYMEELSSALENMSATMQCYTSNDRSLLNIEALFDTSADDDEYTSSYYYQVDTVSSEFVIEISYDIQMINAEDHALISISNFGFVQKDIFADIGGFVGGVVDAGGGIFDGFLGVLGSIISTIFMPLFLLLADVFEGVGDIIVVALEALGTVLGGLFDALLSGIDTVIDGLWIVMEAALGAIEDVLDDVLTALGNLADLIITALIDALEDIIDGIIDLLSIIIDGVGDALWTLADALSISDVSIGDLFRTLANYLTQALSGVSTVLEISVWCLGDGLPLFLAITFALTIFIAMAKANNNQMDFIGNLVHSAWSPLYVIPVINIPIPAGLVTLVVPMVVLFGV